MSDPIQDLENFNSEGLPVNPLAPSEVRRLGDRMRRRRNAAGLVAGVAAIAVIAAPIALYAGRDSSAPSPTPAPSSTTGSPDVDVNPPSPEPITVLLREIPDGFPLASGWPDDSQAESEEMGLEGPNRKLDSLLFTHCHATFDDPDYVDRLRAQWTNVEDYRGRQLTTYADADQAVAAVKGLTDFHRDCPTEDAGGGYARVTDVQRTQVGGESWALVTHYEFGDAPAVGLTITHVIRLGRAVLIDTTSNEGGAGQDRRREIDDQLAAMTSAAAQPVSRMCAFTEAGCGDGDAPIEAPVFGTLGPEGFRGVELGMTLDEALAAGAEVRSVDASATCTAVTIGSEASDPGLDAAMSEARGVAGIFAKPGIKTAEDIGYGSTLAEVKAAYPGTDTSGEYTVFSPVPGYDDRQFATMYDEQDRVVSLVLELDNQDCYR
jgi:hypothetical protein